MSTLRHLTLASSVLLAAFGVAADDAAAKHFPRTTELLSRSADGGFPNGPSRAGAVSHDQRIARVIAYESDATNMVGGNGNGVTDVFAVRRGGQWGTNGTPWDIAAGQTELVSKGLGGAEANGRSYGPAIDGDSHNAPRCIAFVSEASNLVPGDANGKPDAFVYDLASRTLSLVSVNSAGQQADGATYDVTVDGDCERVAFTSDASNLALRSASRIAWRTAQTNGSAPGVRQVYVRQRTARSAHDKVFRGLTFLASASEQGRAGNGHSSDPYFARAGKSVVFTSEASNLVRGDGNGQSDVYQRTFVRRFQHLGHGKGVQALDLGTRLVSATARGKAGNGASKSPSVTDDGRYVAFETRASNLLPDDGNGQSDIVESDLAAKVPMHLWVSKSKAVGRPGNGDSNNPSMSDAGEFVYFDSAATNLKESSGIKDDPNGVRDVFLWNRPTGNVSMESRDSERGYLGRPSHDPATSSRGNYVPFVTANPAADLRLLGRAAEPGAALDQVYLRYTGEEHRR